MVAGHADPKLRLKNKYIRQWRSLDSRPKTAQRKLNGPIPIPPEVTTDHKVIASRGGCFDAGGIFLDIGVGTMAKEQSPQSAIPRC